MRLTWLARVAASTLVACAVLAACGASVDEQAAPAAASTQLAATMTRASCQERRDQASGGRIVGGEPAPPGSAPWQAALMYATPIPQDELAFDASLAADDECKQFLAESRDYELMQICGGSWIGDGWVLTAAHCVHDLASGAAPLADRRIRLGSQSLATADNIFAIAAVVIHAGYSDQRRLDDIALIKIAPDPRLARFEQAGRLKTIALMQPGDRAFDQDELLRVTGWGYTGVRQVKDRAVRFTSGGQVQRKPAELQQLTPIYLPDAMCEKEYTRFYGPGTLCAGVRATDGTLALAQDSCQGDSGGPLTRDDDNGARTLVGIVSANKGCGAGRPAIYTRVSQYAGWLDAARRAAQPGKAIAVPQPAG